MTEDMNGKGSVMSRHDGEPIIDFELEQEMIGIADHQAATEKKKAGAPLIKNRLNDSSDFDLDNY